MVHEGWYDVAKAIPTTSREVLVHNAWLTEGNRAIGRYNHTLGLWEDPQRIPFTEVTHWCDMPETPKGKDCGDE